MSKSKSSHRWLREHFNDPFVKKAQKEGYRSRASFKLLELNQKDRLFKSGMKVVDLGAAPGGWSQVAARQVGAQGKVVASDILPMDSLEGVTFIQGDFTEREVYDDIVNALAGKKANLVISDMAPNMSGIPDVDQTRSIYLVELALDLAFTTLSDNGVFVSKIFHGEGFEGLLNQARQRFSKVLTRKPSASRSRSREVYLVAKGFKN